MSVNLGGPFRANQLDVIWSLQENRLRARLIQKQFEHKQIRHEVVSSREARERVAHDLADHLVWLDSEELRGKRAVLLNMDRCFLSELKRLLNARTALLLEHERREVATHREREARSADLLRLLIKRRYLQELRIEQRLPCD